jgi:hypothetical protein
LKGEQSASQDADGPHASSHDTSIVTSKHTKKGRVSRTHVALSAKGEASSALSDKGEASYALSDKGDTHAAEPILIENICLPAQLPVSNIRILGITSKSGSSSSAYITFTGENGQIYQIRQRLLGSVLGAEAFKQLMQTYQLSQPSS